MENKRIAQNVFVLFSVLSLLHTAFYFFYLPENTAVHLNVFSEVDPYSDLMTLLITNLSLIIFIIVLFTLIVWLMPRTPDKFVNLPHKDYWLDLRRKHETTVIIQAYTYWMGTVTLIFLMISAEESFRANVNGTNMLGLIFWLNLIFFLLAMIYLSIKMYLRFSKLPVKQT